MPLAIRGLGTALPATRVHQGEAAEAAKRYCAETDEQRQMLSVLYRQTEIETRHVVFQAEKVHTAIRGAETDSEFAPRSEHGPTTAQRMERYHKEAVPLATEASRKALAESGIKPGEITHLVTVSCTGFRAPGVDVGLIKGLGLKPTTVRTNVGFMGCHGAINGLRTASAYVGDDPHAKVLLCCVELSSVHHFYGWNPKKMVGNALFADGSAAIVGTPATDSDRGNWRVAATGSCLFPDSEYAMTWDVGNYGFDMMLSTRVPNLIQQNLRPWLTQWLGENRLTIKEVGSWAVHPGGPRILTSVEDAIGLPKGSCEVSRRVLAGHGNMSSPTVLFILDELRKANAPRPCVALGFGPGLVAEGAIFL